MLEKRMSSDWPISGPLSSIFKPEISPNLAHRVCLSVVPNERVCLSVAEQASLSVRRAERVSLSVVPNERVCLSCTRENPDPLKTPRNTDWYP